MNHDHGRFHLEINSIEEFAEFCALIRGNSDDAQIKAQIDRLKQSASALKAAVAANQPPPK